MIIINGSSFLRRHRWRINTRPTSGSEQSWSHIDRRNLYHIVPYRSVLYCIASYCIILYCIILYSIISYRIASYCLISYCIVSVLYYVVLYCVVSYRIVSYCIVSWVRFSFLVKYRLVFWILLEAWGLRPEESGFESIVWRSLCVLLLGEASRSDLGKVRRVLQQKEHHHVRRHRKELSHEPTKRTEGMRRLH